MIDNNVHHFTPALTLLMVAVLRPLNIGDVVTYHGSVTHLRGQKFFVAEVADDLRLRIRDRDYQEDSLKQVRRTSVTPTGERVEVCGCGHTRDSNRHPEQTRVCGAYGCDCVKHGPTPIAVTDAARPLLFAIVRTTKRLRDGAAQTVRDVTGGNISHDNNAFMMRASWGMQLEALTTLARQYIRDCPELGLTRELLDLALSDDPSALHPE